MDPDAALETIRKTYAAYVKAADEMDSESYDRALTELADAFNDLDTWLSKGGFLPSAWQSS